MEAFKHYSLYNLESWELQQVIILACVNQAASDIKKKLQSLERLGENSIRDLVAVAEKVYNKRERHNEKEERRER